MTPDMESTFPEAPPPETGAVAIIYHSETGHTRDIALNAAEKTGATLIEVRPQHHYCRMGKYLRGGMKAATGRKDTIYPEENNISPFDIIIVGTPVWSQHPTPVITGAIAALRGVKKGTRAIVFTTCMAQRRESRHPAEGGTPAAGHPGAKVIRLPQPLPGR